MVTRRFIATFVPNSISTISGTVVFEQTHAILPVRVHFQLSGFKRKGQIHAIHIHEYGDLSNGCISLGGHWNPTNTQHGCFQDGYNHHAGDLINNLIVQEDKCFVYEYMDPFVTLFGKDSILGRSVVIHEGVDDLGRGGFEDSRITGHAGGRLTCAVIGWSSSP